MENTQSYTSSLSERYPSKEMKYLFSPEMKFRTWRKLWIALAETEQELGLPITDEQIAELKAAADDINYDVAKDARRSCATTSCPTYTLTDCSALKRRGSFTWARHHATSATTRT